MITAFTRSVVRRGSVAAAAGAVVILGLVTVSSAAGSEQISAPDVVDELAKSSTPSDQLDARVSLDATLIVEESARLIFSDGHSRHWVSVATTGDICLSSLYYESSSRWTAGTTCLPPNHFRVAGLRLAQGLDAPTAGTDVTLIPDGIASEEVRSTVEAAGGTVPVDNLVVFPVGHRPDVLTVPGLDGRELSLGD